LNIETQPRDDHQVRLIVDIDPEYFSKFKYRASRKISEKRKIPGFRPGKAPYDVVKRYLGENEIIQEAIEILVDEIYPTMLTEAKVDPAGPGSLDEVINMDPPKLAFTVPLRPVVKLSDYHAIRQEYSLLPIGDEDIQKILVNLQNNSTSADTVERKSHSGDVVSIKFHGVFTSPNENENPEAYRESTYQFVVADEKDTWPYPGFTNQLDDLATGETKEFAFTYPDDYAVGRMKGKEVKFTIDVLGVKERKLPELNDEFAQSIDARFLTLDNLKQEIRKELESSKLQDYESGYVGKLIDLIIEQSDIKYPPLMLDEEVEHALHHLEDDLGRKGMDLATYLKSRNVDRETFIENEVRPAARHELCQNLVVAEIAKTDGIEVNTDELQNQVLATLSRLRDSQDYKEFIRKNGIDNLVRSVTLSTASRLLNRDTFNRLITIAKGEYPPAVEIPDMVVDTVLPEQIPQATGTPKKKRKSKPKIEVISGEKDG
jgi:trigger factor